MDDKEVRKAVRSRYGSIARKGGSCCSSSSCCSSDEAAPMTVAIGYSADDLGAVPEGSNLGLGCGNPIAIAGLKEGETVLDLGSGAGFDCFLAARKVGAKGKVIGVDMTHEMLERARENARKGGYRNVEFRLGEIEHLPVADASVDVIISNCVVNLSTDKQGVFDEAFRVLKGGGRLMVSDLVLEGPLPERIAKSIEAYVGCISGAIPIDEFISGLRKAGLSDVEVRERSPYPFEISLTDPGTKRMFCGVDLARDDLDLLRSSVVSAKITARKP
jgi:SAM-dependent methyltransferase